MIVKWECGCIGLLLTVGDKRQGWVIKACDDNDRYTYDDGIGLHRRLGLEEKGWEALGEVDADTLLGRMGTKMWHGAKYREIRFLLGVKD